ncbi:MAG TPA: ATP-binding protein [Polyangiaceae bacterium]|nr:ATP-binding protein [Polyangiaceae bacterium]
MLATVGLVTIVLLFALATNAYLSALGWVDHTLEVRHVIDHWLLAVRSSEATARRYVDSGKPGDLDDFSLASAGALSAQERLGALVEDNPSQVRAVAAAAADARLVLDAYRELVALTSAGHSREALERLLAHEHEQKTASDRFENDCEAMQQHEARLLLERRELLRRRVLLALAGGSALGASAFALLIAAWSSRGRREVELGEAASAARRRLRTLSEVAVALSEVRTTAEVARVVVDTGMAAFAADVCTLYLLDPSGATLELIGDRGVPPPVLEKIRKMSNTGGNPVAFRTLQTGEAIWAESEADYERLFPSIAHLPAQGPRAKAFWSVPLVVEGRPVGLLGMGFYAPRQFSEDDKVLVDTLCRQCGQALYRAERLEAEEEARRWFTTTLRSIGDAVIATDPAGMVTFMNPVAETITGWPEAEARGRPLDDVFQIFSERTRAVVESPVTKVLREGTVVGLANHTILRSRRGTEVPIDDSGAPIRNERGALIGVVMVFRDVSADKADRARRDFLSQAGEALVSSMDYQATLGNVARMAVPAIADWCAVEILEPGARASYQAAVAHVDPKKVEFARRLGERYPPDPEAKRGVPEVIRSGRSELYREIPAEMIENTARDEEHKKLLRELGLRSGMVVPLRSHGRTLGALTFVYAESNRRYGDEDLAFAEDFARRAAMAIENALALRQLEDSRAQERKLRAEAEVASRAKDEFLAMVSHELRTPLNAILGWTVMLRAPNAAQNLERGLAVIERNARAQAKLIEDVLDVSRIISGKLALSLGPTVIGEAILASIETVTPAAQAKAITISASVPERPITITADAQRIQQVVWNLLSNAVKFTPKGGSIRVRVSLDGSDVRIEVSDSGEGIRAESLPYVFEPFQQADTSTTRRHGGLGLGLAIVKQLVVAHGGTVSAHSDGPAKGATFLVELPARSAIPAISAAARGAAAAGDGAGVGASRLDGLRLLVVDDEEDALALVSQVLVAHGAEVFAAASAKDALEKLPSVRPDVIVSDIGMPGEDGYTLVRKIRSLPAEDGGRTPAIALTAYAREEDAQRAFAAGYQLHVAKPVEPAQLARMVANLGGRTLGGSD